MLFIHLWLVLLQDKYCMEAFQVAHDRAINDKKMHLIIILVGEPPLDAMPENMRYYLKTRAYLRWGSKWFWKKLIYRMPHVVRPPRRLDPEGYYADMCDGADGDPRESRGGGEDVPMLPIVSAYSEASEVGARESVVLGARDSSASGHSSVGYASQSPSGDEDADEDEDEETEETSLNQRQD